MTMKCKRCGTENPDAKRTCMECGAILEGYTFNNVTGEYGYRGADGNFYKSENDYRSSSSTAVPQYKVANIAPVITVEEPIGYLVTDYVKGGLAVYKPIGWLKRLMLRWCFGLTFKAAVDENLK